MGSDGRLDHELPVSVQAAAGATGGQSRVDSFYDWKEVARLLLVSRAIDDIEEQELYPQKKIAYQFSSRGHALAQILLGQLLHQPYDCASAYYRSRPLLLALGLDVADAFAGPLGKSGSYSDGRDIGVVCNLLSTGKATVLPMAGDVGSQYTPAAGWAQAIEYYRSTMRDERYRTSVAVALGGEGSTATNGFWSALNIVTTRNLPFLFFIEDNGYAISVPSTKQTPGGNIAENLSVFKSLRIIQVDGTDPELAGRAIADAVQSVRGARQPVMLRLEVPRLAGHSGQDSQSYIDPEQLRIDNARDPLPKLKGYLVPNVLSAEEWENLASGAEKTARDGLARALERAAPKIETIGRFAFSERDNAGRIEFQKQGGGPKQFMQLTELSRTQLPVATEQGPRVNMLEAIRRTLECELERNSHVLVFGEDVGPKGGVHAATMGLQERFGVARVFDTSLSEEGIIGRAVGMALAGLVPIPEIQFRKYADAATEQLNNCGTIRWRTNNRFAAPFTVRMPVGHSRRAGDPWHSVCGESIWAHQVGWRIAMPSNAADAVGLLRTAIRSNDPVLFFEHRALLDHADARRPYPGDDYVLPLGVANRLQEGDDLTVVTWGAMVEKCSEAAAQLEASIEILDLRTICPWDRDAVFASVRKTKRCVIVHEDTMTAGFGAEIAAQLADELFSELDAPIKRIAPGDIPIPYAPELMNSVLPSVQLISRIFTEVLSF